MNDRIKDYKQKVAARNQDYAKMIKKYSPLQSTLKSLLKAFLVGGLICIIGQVVIDLTTLWWPDVDPEVAGSISGIVLITLTCIFTGIGIFDKLALLGGGGTFLPITGFANSISSAAIEYRAEGFIFGLASKFFSLAGAVIINGIMGSFVVGLVYWILGLCGVVL